MNYRKAITNRSGNGKGHTTNRSINGKIEPGFVLIKKKSRQSIQF